MLPTLDRVAHVEQDLEVQLLSAIREVERRHLGRVVGGLGAIERLTVHLVEVAEDLFAGAAHRDSLEGSKGQARWVVEISPRHGKIAVAVQQKSFRGAQQPAARIERIGHVKRLDVFARDGYRCMYCGGVFPAEDLTVDHVQPRVRGGDHSGGNVVTACSACNTDKGSARLADYLRDHPVKRANFLTLAVHVWPRHLRTLLEELGPET